MAQIRHLHLSRKTAADVAQEVLASLEPVPPLSTSLRFYLFGLTIPLLSVSPWQVLSFKTALYMHLKTICLQILPTVYLIRNVVFCEMNSGFTLFISMKK